MYLKNVWKSFISACKLDLRFIFVLLYEILFVLVVTGLLWLFLDVVYRLALTAKDLPTAAFTPANVDLLKQFYVNSVIAFIVLFILIVFAYVIFQGLGWGQVLKKPLTPRFVWRFFLANLLWLVPWFLAAWFFIVAFQQTFVVWGMIIVAILFTHLTLLYQHELVAKGATIKEAISHAFSNGILGIHRFILPYVLATLVFLLWSQIWRFFNLQTPSIFTAVMLAGIIFAPFLAWLKFYMNRVLTVI